MPGTPHCRHRCGQYAVDTIKTRAHSYLNGEKRCINCSMWVKCEGTFCPCCGTRLRTKPRTNRQRQARIEDIMRY